MDRAHARQIAELIEAAKKDGVSDDLLARVKAAAETREDYIEDLKVLAQPRGYRTTPKLPPLPAHVHDRELDPHEEAIFEEMLAGEHQPVMSE